MDTATLMPDEEQATKEFVERVNEIRRAKQAGPLPWNTAIKFLMARKFDVSRAVSLYEQHEATRQREGLVNLSPLSDPLRLELTTGKFTILPCRDSTGAAIAVFTARLHDPKQTTHQTTLQGVVYQLDAALESTETQRCGLIFVYDMTESAYHHFDYQLSQKILTLLKGGYPARLKKVLIVTAPLWFKAPFKVLRLFVREKLRDRVYTVGLSELANYIPAQCLPKTLGGILDIDHKEWLKRCSYNSMTNRHPSDQCDISAPVRNEKTVQEDECIGQGQNKGKDQEQDQSQDPNKESLLDSNCGEEDELDLPDFSDDDDDFDKSLSEGEDGDPDPEAGQRDEEITCGMGSRGSGKEQPSEGPTESTIETADVLHINGHTEGEGPETMPGRESPQAPPSSGSSGFSDDDSLHLDDGQGLTLEEFVHHLKDKGRHGLCQDYMQIKSRPPEGTFDTSRQRGNMMKNRYTDVLCYDHSRVILSQEDEEEHTTYINGNYVDGYKQKNAFISCQGPLPATFGDFWRMIWEQNVCIVVMTTRVLERGKTKCGQYWPTEQGTTQIHSHYTIKNTCIQQFTDYVVTHITITDNDKNEERSIEHFQFTSWPDYGVPETAMAMLDFLCHVRESQERLTAALQNSWVGHPLGPPIVVHCSAGIGRTGTFCTLDICIKRLEDVGTIDVKGTVEKIRSQRAYSIQMPDQYVFCHLALLEYAINTNKLVGADLGGFEDDASDSD